MLQPDALPFEGLELGPLVGRGSFGRVYRGRWQDKIVAVKVRRLPQSCLKSSAWDLETCTCLRDRRPCQVKLSQGAAMSPLTSTDSSRSALSNDANQVAFLNTKCVMGGLQICGPLGGGKTAYPDICKSVEAIASSKLSHPNIVKALRHCTILAHGAFSRLFIPLLVL